MTISIYLKLEVKNCINGVIALLSECQNLSDVLLWDLEQTANVPTTNAVRIVIALCETQMIAYYLRVNA